MEGPGIIYEAMGPGLKSRKLFMRQWGLARNFVLRGNGAWLEEPGITYEAVWPGQKGKELQINCRGGRSFMEGPGIIYEEMGPGLRSRELFTRQCGLARRARNCK